LPGAEAEQPAAGPLQRINTAMIPAMGSRVKKIQGEAENPGSSRIPFS